MKVTISKTWLRQPWSLPVWDAAYAYITRAGSGDDKAKAELDGIKLAAQTGNSQVVAIKRNFDAVAKLILAGHPKPSQFVAQQRARRSPLLPGGRRPAAPLATTVKKQAEQLAAQKRTQLEQARRARLAKQAQARVATLKTEHAGEQQALTAELELLRRELERRDLAEEVRKKLEAQADQYEARLEELERSATSAEPPPAPITEATAAEQPEAEQDDAAAAYPSGAPGDVEFNDAANG